MIDELALNDPQTLYRRWEDSQWSPFSVDLSLDAAQWPGMSGDERELILYVLSSLMVAEERITTKFSGLVGAYGSEEEATFLATQQVDEARHMQFYARFQDEVVAAPAEIAAHVERARSHVSDAFRRLFDEELVRAHLTLVAEPGSLSAKVRFVTLYHLILEATLGLTSFKFTTDYLSGAGLLPGFVDGYSRIHHDETRHIGYGVWFLRETVRCDGQMGDVVRDALRQLLPSVAASLSPPDGGPAADFEAIGAGVEEIRAFALGGLTRRLEMIGVPLESL
jgi:ribonucleoside-diphosphate reductase beta chain